MNTQDYARWFRATTPYISTHRRQTFVVLLPGEALAHGNLTNIVHDLALLHVLGVRLVVVHGARPQINAALPESRLGTHKGVSRRVTDAEAIGVIAGVCGQLRSELEALFSTGVPSSPLHNAEIQVVSGNFVTAKPSACWTASTINSPASRAASGRTASKRCWTAPPSCCCRP